MILPVLIGVIEILPKIIRVKLLFLGRYKVDGIFFRDLGKLYILGDTLSAALGLTKFMDLMIDDFWVDFFTMEGVELIKHDTHGFIFRLNN